VALDGNLADGQAVLGWIQMGYDWKWAAANDSFQRALALEPGNIRAIEGAAMLANAHGHTGEALRLCRRLVELNPLDAASHIELGDIANNAGYPEEATPALRKALELNPEVPQAHLELGLDHLAQSQPQRALAEMELEPELGWRLTGLALSYQALERSNEADNALAELISKYESTMAYQIAEIYAYRNQVDRSFEWLERAYAQHDGGLTDVIADPRMENLRHDPRYPVFLKKMHLVE
jgi:tetratricopeptide (TPR) repeat protein